MKDRRNRKIFVILAVFIGIFLILPSTLFIRKLRDYQNFFLGINPSVLKQSQDSLIPADGHRDLPFKPKLSFVEFHLKAPQARKVDLSGSFNNWTKGTLKMMKKGNGEWSIFLPVPKGRYQYLFVVDGKDVLDPSNSQVEIRDGHPVSVKEVQ